MEEAGRYKRLGIVTKAECDFLDASPDSAFLVLPVHFRLELCKVRDNVSWEAHVAATSHHLQAAFDQMTSSSWITQYPTMEKGLSHILRVLCPLLFFDRVRPLYIHLD